MRKQEFDKLKVGDVLWNKVMLKTNKHYIPSGNTFTVFISEYTGEKCVRLIQGDPPYKITLTLTNHHKKFKIPTKW